MPASIALILTVLSWVVLLAAVVAFVDVARRPAAAFPAVERQTKVFWLIVLGISALLVSPIMGASLIGIFGLIAVVAVCFYYADVRPKVTEITRR